MEASKVSALPRSPQCHTPRPRATASPISKILKNAVTVAATPCCLISASDLYSDPDGSG